MCKQLQYIKYESQIEKTLSDFEGEAQTLFYLQ